jgi:hypothetical protein
MKDLGKRVEELKAEMAGKVSEKYMERAEQPGVETNSLPANGLFGKVYASGSKTDEADFRHLRLPVVDETGKNIPGKSISLSNVKANALIGKGDVKDTDFGVISKEGVLKGKLYLKGTTINPAFAGLSVFETAALLEGSKFTASKKQGRVLRYNKEGYSTVDEAKDATVVKDFFEIEVIE